MKSNDSTLEEKDHFNKLYCEKFWTSSKFDHHIRGNELKIVVRKWLWNHLQIERDDKQSPYEIKLNGNCIDLVYLVKIALSKTASSTVDSIDIFNCFLEKYSMYLNLDTEQISNIFAEMLLKQQQVHSEFGKGFGHYIRSLNIPENDCFFRHFLLHL